MVCCIYWLGRVKNVIMALYDLSGGGHLSSWASAINRGITRRSPSSSSWENDAWNHCYHPNSGCS
jgi:hypothetical protein